MKTSFNYVFVFLYVFHNFQEILINLSWWDKSLLVKHLLQQCLQTKGEVGAMVL